MTIEDFYVLVDGDYAKVMEDLEKEERIRRFLRKFTETQMPKKIEKALMEEDYRSAFLQSHSLKGMSMNISLTRLTSLSSELTENLREGPTGEEAKAFLRVHDEYERVCELIKQLDG